MQAAAKNLTSITLLELGGKSPVIVDDTADLQEVAEKVGWVKCMNTWRTNLHRARLSAHQSASPDSVFRYITKTNHPLLRQKPCAVARLSAYH